MSVVGLDSAQPPTADQASAAAAAGVRLWSGYIGTKPNLGLYHVWTQQDFDNARLCGGTPIAFCSGWDDPVACKALAANWNVRLCLDVESGIRGDGPWVQPFLDASGAGLYGVSSVHSGRRAAFHVLAWYVFNAGLTWPGQKPPAPTGWQWENSHSEFGVTVDRGWYDDWFGQGEDVTQEEHNWLQAIYQWITTNGDPLLRDIDGKVGKLGQPTLPSGTTFQAKVQ